MNKRSEKQSKKEKTMLFRILLIVATDIICWLPVIIFTFLVFFGYSLPDIVHSFTSIVLLPINSLLNPILYSRLDATMIKAVKKSIFTFKNFIRENLKIKSNS